MHVRHACMREADCAGRVVRWKNRKRSAHANSKVYGMLEPPPVLKNSERHPIVYIDSDGRHQQYACAVRMYGVNVHAECSAVDVMIMHACGTCGSSVPAPCEKAQALECGMHASVRLVQQHVISMVVSQDIFKPLQCKRDRMPTSSQRGSSRVGHGTKLTPAHHVQISLQSAIDQKQMRRGSEQSCLTRCRRSQICEAIQRLARLTMACSRLIDLPEDEDALTLARQEYRVCRPLA